MPQLSELHLREGDGRAEAALQPGQPQDLRLQIAATVSGIATTTLFHRICDLWFFLDKIKAFV